MRSSIQVSDGGYHMDSDTKTKISELVNLFEKSPIFNHYNISASKDHISFKINNSQFIKLHPRNITYLGNPHPKNKKRFQVPNKWNEYLYDPMCLFTGVYNQNNNFIFVILFNPNHLNNKNNQSSVHVSVAELRSAFYQKRHYKKDNNGNEFLMVNLSELGCFIEYLKSIFNTPNYPSSYFEKILTYFRSTEYHLDNIIEEFSTTIEFLKSNINFDNIDFNENMKFTQILYQKIYKYYNLDPQPIMNETHNPEFQNSSFYVFIKKCRHENKNSYQISTELCEKFKLSFDESIRILEKFHSVNHESEPVCVEQNEIQEEIFNIGEYFFSKGKSNHVNDQFVRWFSTDNEISQGSNAFNVYRGISSARFLDQKDRKIAFFIFSSSSYTKEKNTNFTNNEGYSRINIYSDKASENLDLVEYMGDGRPGKEWFHHHNHGNNQIIDIIRTQLSFPPIFYFDRQNKGELKFLGIYKPIKIEIIETHYNMSYFSNLKITISRIQHLKSINASWIKRIREQGVIDNLYEQMLTPVKDIVTSEQLKI